VDQGVDAMTDDTNADRGTAALPSGALGSITQLASRRRCEDVLSSMTFVFGGVHYGTIPISAPYLKGKPIVLYIVPQNLTSCGETMSGPLDCLITDDLALGADLGIAR
jgi:hypothetical protein